MAVAYKDSRINLRTSLDDKSLLERAASLRHLSLSSYIIATSIRQAQLHLRTCRSVPAQLLCTEGTECGNECDKNIAPPMESQ